jgi:hypothetical protein
MTRPSEGPMAKGRPVEGDRQKFIDATTERGADARSAETFRKAVRDVAARVKETKQIITRKRNHQPLPRR